MKPFRFFGVFVLGALLTVLLSSLVVSAQSQLWRIDGRVLDTTGRFDRAAIDAFNVESMNSGYPVYLLVLDEKLFHENTLITAQIALAVFNGEYGAQYRWDQMSRGDGYFPDDFIVVSVAPFVQRPDMPIEQIPDDNPWMRANVEVHHSNRFTPLSQSLTVYNGEQMTWSVATAQRIDDELVATGKFNSPAAAQAVTYIADAYKLIGINPDGQNASVQTPPPTSTTTRSDGGGGPLWIVLWQLIGLAIASFISYFLYKYGVRWWIARMKAISAAETAAHLSAGWSQFVQIAQTKIAAVGHIAPPHLIQSWRNKVEKANRQADAPQERYNKVMRAVGSPKRWLTTEGYAFIASEITQKLLVDLEAAAAALREIDTEIATLEALVNQANADVTRAGSTVDGALTAVEASAAEGYPAPGIESLANEAFGLYQQAQLFLTSREYIQAVESATQAVDLAKQASHDIAGWRARIGNLPHEIANVIEQLGALHKKLPDLVQIIASFRDAYVHACWDEVEHHPAAIERLLEQLGSQVQQAQNDREAKRYDVVVTALDEVGGGIEKILSLTKSLTERAEDLRELSKNLPGLIKQARAQAASALAYIKTHAIDVDAESEDAVDRAVMLLNRATEGLGQQPPDVEMVERLYEEALSILTTEIKEMKDEVEAMKNARQEAQNMLTASAQAQSRLLNFIEDHEDEVGSVAKRKARDAQRLHTSAAAAWETAETLGDGYEPKRLQLYAQVVTEAKQARDTAFDSLDQAKEDAAPPAPTWTPPYTSTPGGGYSSGGGYNQPSIPVYKPAPQPQPATTSPSKPSPRPIPTISSGGSNRTYTAPKVQAPKAGTLTGGGSRRR